MSADAWADAAQPVGSGDAWNDAKRLAVPSGGGVPASSDAWDDVVSSESVRADAVRADAMRADGVSAGSGEVESGHVDPFDAWGQRRGASGEAVPFAPPGGAVEDSDDPFEELGRRRNASGEALRAPAGAVRVERPADDPFDAPARTRETPARERPGSAASAGPGAFEPGAFAGGAEDDGAAESASAFGAASKRASGGGSRGRSGRGRTSGRRGAKEVDPDAEAAPVDPVKEQRKATDICYALLTARARTRVELKEALLRKGIREETAEVVLGKFDRAGLIDDAAFAEVWVRSRHAYQGLGRRALARELRQKGVADEVAAEAVAAVDDEAEQERARELVRKKLRSMSGVDDQAKIRRLVGALARKGYAEGMAYRVVREELRAAEVESPLDDFLPD